VEIDVLLVAVTASNTKLKLYSLAGSRQKKHEKVSATQSSKKKERESCQFILRMKY
jgi:hypothetical protein